MSLFNIGFYCLVASVCGIFIGRMLFHFSNILIEKVFLFLGGNLLTEGKSGGGHTYKLTATKEKFSIEGKISSIRLGKISFQKSVISTIK